MIKTPKILNVDDHEVNRYIRTQTLEAAGYAVIEASNGTEALRLFEQDRPQLVLLDMVLPDIGGAEVCRRIRAHPDVHSVIVLHISATKTSPQDRVHGLQGGADGYLVEPVEPELLLATVRSLLRLWTAEAQLEESAAEARQLAARYQGLLEAIPHMVFTATPDGRNQYVSNAVSHLTGETATTALGHGWKGFVHPDDLDGVMRRWTDSVSSGEPYEAEYRVRQADGSYRWAFVRAAPVTDELGKVVQWVGTLTDVHERRVLDEEIRRRHEEFVALAEHSPDIIARIDPDLRFVYVNPAVSRISSHPPGQYAGKTSREVGWPATVSDLWEEKCWHALETGARCEYEFSVEAGAEHRWFMTRIVPEFSAEAAVDSLLTITADITDRKTAESAMRAMNAELQQTNEDLGQFAYAASHDLQEPLRTIASYTELLLREYSDTANGNTAEYTEFIQQAVGRMQKLIQDLLAFSYARNVQLFAGVPIPLSDILEASSANLKQAVDESNAHILFDNLPRIPVDFAQFTLVFQNLLGNAIKYRKPGHVPEIRITASHESGLWTISVIDNGQGFDEIYAEHIFGAFKRLHGREIPGTGIGLAIVKRIVERHGGRVWAESKPGEGAKFSFTIPAAVASANNAV